MRKIQIGIMGPGKRATDIDVNNAYNIGKLCAEKDYLVFTGGRPSGVMESGLKGAKDAGGLTMGILPYNKKSDATDYADIVVVTAMMSARNNINAMTCDVMIICGIDSGTLSEIALAYKSNIPVIILSDNNHGKQFLTDLQPDLTFVCQTPEEAIAKIEKILKNNSNDNQQDQGSGKSMIME
jgi:uncharacterized protein (TIGR00725 family)